LIDELRSKLLGRVAVVGVGDSRNGDDGAGPMIAGLLADAGIDRVIDAGPSPELETWRLRELTPRTVLFVDAVDFGGEPGDAALLEPEDLRSKGFDTHRAPLRLTMEYLERELGADCYLVAVQPRDVKPGKAMCREVRQSSEALARVLSDELRTREG